MIFNFSVVNNFLYETFCTAINIIINIKQPAMSSSILLHIMLTLEYVVEIGKFCLISCVSYSYACLMYALLPTLLSIVMHTCMCQYCG